MAEGRFAFSPKTLQKLPIPEKSVTVHDTTEPSLSLRVDPTGTKTFFWFRSVKGFLDGAGKYHARNKYKTLGTYPTLDIEAARNRARKWQSILSDWRMRDYAPPDPFLPTPEETVKRLPTFLEVVELYIAGQVHDHAAHPEKAAKYLRWQVKTYLKTWEPRRLDEIRSEDVRRRKREIAEANGVPTSNRVTQAVRRIFRWAIEVEELWTAGINPCRGIKYKENPNRMRILTPEEAARLFAALRDELNTDLRDFVWLAITTEARRSDVLSMRWCDLDLDRKGWSIPEPKGGRKHAYQQKLIDEALAVLKEREARKSEDAVWVFPSPESASGHLEEPKRSWKGLLTRAALGDFRIHDLRHVLPSVQVALGESLPIIGSGLGHRPNSPATAIYANLNNDPQHRAMSNAMKALKAIAREAEKKAARKPKRIAALPAVVVAVGK